VNASVATGAISDAHPGLKAAIERVFQGTAAKLVVNPRLREVVEAKLDEWWSPAQISSSLVDAYPGDEEMRASHETSETPISFPVGGCVRSFTLEPSPRDGRQSPGMPRCAA
jgi:IS30 family transposase